MLKMDISDGVDGMVDHSRLARLQIGATVAASLRKAVFDELQYTCSAGISHNKMCATVCSVRSASSSTALVSVLVLLVDY